MQITSEVKNGFKETEIGLIPEDWEIKPLGQKAEIRGGRRVLGIQRVAMIPMELIQNDRVYAGYNFLDAKEIKSGVFCEEGDILLPKITPCIENGKQGIVPRVPNGVAIATTEVYPLRCKEGLDPLFLFYLLKTQKFRNVLINSMVGTTGRRRVPKDVVLKLLIPIPPLPEQQKIAFVLSKIQQAIQQQDKIIEAAKNLKKTIMHKLFTEGIGHTEFKDTEIGRIPKSWEIKKLGDVAKLTSGGTPNRKVGHYFGGSIPWVKSGELEDNIIFDTEEKITEEGLRNSAAKIFPKGTLLIAMYGATVGKTGILGVEAATNQAVCAVFPKSNTFLPDFLRYYIIFARTKLLSERFGGAQPNISQTILRNINIPLPSISEQREIANILSSIDKKIDIEERKKSALQQLFKTMLHKLMTGEIRVKDLDLGVSNVD